MASFMQLEHATRKQQVYLAKKRKTVSVHTVHISFVSICSVAEFLFVFLGAIAAARGTGRVVPRGSPQVVRGATKTD
jgi:alpha-D-ribose 1-methylphosphonate 5-triphosphate diphosphatase PhnM